MHRCHDAAVRTTLDLPDDLHRWARAIALIQRGPGQGTH